MTTTAAHIIPKPATHYSLDIFSKPEVLVSFDNSFEQETLPVTAHDAPVFEFVLTTDRNIYLDLQSVELKLEAKIGKGANGNTNLETELAGGNTVAKATDKVSFINNTLHSFFSNCDILINNEIVHTSNNLYAQRAFVETELSHTQGCATTKLITQGYNFEPATGDMLAHRETWTLGSASKTFYGKLAVDFLACDQLLIPNCSMRIRLTRNKPEYLLQSAVTNPAFTPKIERVSIFARYYTVAENYHVNLQRSLLKWPARYNYFEVRSKTFVIPRDQSHFIREDIFNAEPIRRMVLAMCPNNQFTGRWTDTPLAFHKHNLKKVRVLRNGVPVVEYSTSSNTQLYFKTIQNLHFDQDGPLIKLDNYENHYYLVFDLTSTLLCNQEIYYPEIVGAPIRIELEFSTNTSTPLELFVLGERFTTVQIDHTGKVLKHG